MALLVDASGEFIDHGSAASLDNFEVGTVMSWIYVTADNSGSSPQRVGSKGNYFLFGFAFNGQGQAFIERTGGGSASTHAFATRTNFSAWGLNKWMFFAAVVDGTSTVPRLYIGDLNTPAAEPSSYVIQDAGAGSQRSNATRSWYAGNNPQATTEYLGGDLASQHIIGAALSASEIQNQQWQFQPHANTLLLAQYGVFDGVGSQIDISGNGNHGTITGATLSAHPPVPWWPSPMPFVPAPQPVAAAGQPMQRRAELVPGMRRTNPSRIGF